MIRKKGNFVEEKREELVEYSIKGKVDTEKLKEISPEISIVAYAVGNRRVLGSAPVERDGSFEIKYRYKVFGKNKEPYGVDLIIGPDLPGDHILKTKFERRFLSSKGFKKASPYAYTVPKVIVVSISDIEIYKKTLIILRRTFTYCGFVYTCSPLQSPPGGQAGCKNPEALSSADAEAYVRLSGVSWFTGESYIIGEDIEIGITGKFEKTEKYIIPFFPPTTVRVEVYQKTDEGEHILYTRDHSFQDGIAEDIFIDRDKVKIISIPPKPTPAPGGYFGFERIGNIVVEAIYKEGEVTGEFGPGVSVPDEFVGYINSKDKPGVTLGEADRRVKDYAFGGSLHFYANIGENFGTSLADGVDMSEVRIKYFRIKYSYLNPETNETIGDTYLSVPFHNTRNIPEGTTAEFMGPFSTHPQTGEPLMNPTYKYPNPYDTDPERNWKYRGLVLVLDTTTLPRKYGRYTFTIEPLGADMGDVDVADENDCVLTLLIDNDYDALTGEIKGIYYRDGTDHDWKGTDVCGVANITGVTQGNKSEIKVEYKINDRHGNLEMFTVKALYGKNISIDLADGTYSRSGNVPHWCKVEDEVVKNLVWIKCAYQFRIVAWRKVTNGFYDLYWKEFTYHIYIDSNKGYTP